MGSSLIVGRFDLLDPSTSPILLQSFDRGAPVPSVSEIQSTVLDGAVVSGRAANNRTIVLPVVVKSLGDRLTQASLANELLQIVDSATWTLTFTPDGGLPVVYDCFRASVQVTSDLLADQEGWQAFTITAEALPYGRSVTQQTATLTGSTVTLDSFNTAPTVATGPDSRQTSTPTGAAGTAPVYEGSKNLTITPNEDGNGRVQFQATRTGLSIAAAAALTTVVIQAQHTHNWTPLFATQWRLDVTVSSVVYTAYSSDQPRYESWTPVTFTFATPIPAGTVTAWKLTSPVLDWDTLPTARIYLDFLRAFATTATLVSSTNGSFLTLPAVVGSARAPVALSVARTNSSAFSSWCVHVPPSDQPSAQPLIPMGGTSTATYTTASTVRYGGTYSVWIAVSTTGTASSWPLPIVFTQSVPSGGASTTLTASLTTAVAGNFLLYAGEVTLPLTAYPADAQVTTTVACNTGLSSIVVQDILLLDTRGQTIIVDSTAPAYVAAWVDEPAPGVGFGGAYSGAARASATSVAPHLAVASTLLFNPGASNILTYSPEGPLTVAFTYSPRWLQEATA